MQVSHQVSMRAAEAAIGRLGRITQDATPVTRAIGDILIADARMAFRESRDPWGNPWAPLSQTTLEQRAMRRSGGKLKTKGGKVKKSAQRIMATAQPLLDTGRLRNSITAVATADSVTVGTNVIYAGTQQFGAGKGAYGRNRRGSPIPWGLVPARPFLPIRNGEVDLPPATRRAIVDAITSFIVRR